MEKRTIHGWEILIWGVMKIPAGHISLSSKVLMSPSVRATTSTTITLLYVKNEIRFLHCCFLFFFSGQIKKTDRFSAGFFDVLTSFLINSAFFKPLLLFGSSLTVSLPLPLYHQACLCCLPPMFWLLIYRINLNLSKQLSFHPIF